MTIPLLTYELKTTPETLTVDTKTASLQVVATNSNPTVPAKLKIVGISLPTGNVGEALISAGTDTITPGAPTGWKPAGTMPAPTEMAGIQYLFAAEAESEGAMVAGDPLIFTLSDLTLNGMEGTSTVTISEWSELTV